VCVNKTKERDRDRETERQAERLRVWRVVVVVWWSGGQGARWSGKKSKKLTATF